MHQLILFIIVVIVSLYCSSLFSPKQNKKKETIIIFFIFGLILIALGYAISINKYGLNESIDMLLLKKFEIECKFISIGYSFILTSIFILISNDKNSKKE